MTWDREGRRIGEEVAHHLEELEEQLRAEGLSEAEARREARRRFGDPERVERRTRQVHGTSEGWMAGVGQDVRHALRGLRRAPGFAATVALTLALALGATIAVFSVVWDVLLRPLDVRDPASLVVLLERMPGDGIEASPTSEGTFHDWRAGLSTVEEVAGWEWVTRTWEDPERPEELVAAQVSGNLLPLLGIRPVVGRVLTPADEVVGGPSQSVMISYDLWQRRFGGDPGIVGRELPIDGTRRTVVGVAPRRMELLGASVAADLLDPSAHIPADPTNRGSRILHTVAHLAPGASLAAVRNEVARLTEEIATTYPASARGWTGTAEPLRSYLLGDIRPRLLVASVAVALLLLVAAVNVANLLLVRAADGRRELAVRAALGAGTGRLVRFRVVESLALGLAGGVGGLAVAAGIQRWFAAVYGDALPRSMADTLPVEALIFGALLAVGVGLAVGVVPAVRGAGRALATLGRGLAGAGTGVSPRYRSALVVAQLALTTVLLVGAGLLVRTVDAIGEVDLGFEPDRAVAARISVSAARYPSRDAQRVYWDDLLARVRALPGVESAGLVSALPMDPVAAAFDLPTRTDPGTPWGEAPQVDFRIITPGYMESAGYRLVEGRFFGEQDRVGPPTAVVNRSAAEAFWPGESAIGKPIQNVWFQGGAARVVGVVEDTRFYGPMAPTRTEMYVPHAHASWSFMTVVARTAGDPAALQPALERAFRDADPVMPPQDVFPVAAMVEAATRSERVFSLLLSGFGLLALILAAAGVYGVLSYTVRIRTREIGVRMALGQSRGAVTQSILQRGAALSAIGVVLGLIVALPATRLVSGMLFGVSPVDGVTLGSVAGILVTVGALACLLPARRAARLDPARVLREE